MTPSERWRRVQELCGRLEQVPEALQEEEARRLEGDEGVRREALDVLAALREEEAERGREAEAERERAREARPGGIRGVRVLELLGAGGSGSVYRAMRRVDESEQVVALKVYHATGTTVAQRARIVREQRILAALNHPSIVKLLDAGVTEEGRPYLVMELVEGAPIGEYCERLRLGVAARVRLMLAVCEAVRAAHHQLIAHLDLKPSNVLVTAEGQVKLLDFGTAQMMEDGGELARTGQMTPLYASPERLRGESITVASDVYALGLILYEVLSGSWPFADRSSMLGIAERATGKVEARRLGERIGAAEAAARGLSVAGLRAALRGDLEAICGRALAADERQRYESAGRLADDLRRYLEGEPVEARGQGRLYRAGKFVRRHAWGVAVTAAMAAALSGATVYSLGQARNAERAAARATAARDFLGTTFELSSSDAAGRPDLSFKEVLELAEGRVAGQLGDDAETAALVEISLARGYLGQNEFGRAKKVLERALERLRGGAEAAVRAQAEAQLGYVLYLLEDRNGARTLAMSALRQWEEDPGRFTKDEAVTTLLVTGRTLSYLEPSEPKYRGYLKKALDLARTLPARTNGMQKAAALSQLAAAELTVEFRPEEARAMLVEAIAIARRDPRMGAILGDCLQLLGMAERYAGRLEESEAAHREAYGMAARLLGAESPVAATRQAHWAMSLTDLGRTEEGWSEARKALERKRAWFPKRGSSLLWTNLHAASYTACGAGRYAECEALARESLESLGAAEERDYRLQDGRTMVGLALAGQGRRQDAAGWLTPGVEFNRRLGRRVPYAAVVGRALAGQ